MTPTRPTPEEERLLELLCDRATEGLGESEERILAALLARHPEIDPWCMDEAATLVDLAFQVGDERADALPPELEGRLRQQARFAAAARSGEGDVRDWRSSLGWWAAAAALVIAVLGWLPGEDGRAAGGPAARRRTLIAEAGDVVRASWQGLGDARYAAVSGDVVWSPARQEGYMRLRNLPANDATREQYQLWIVDPGVDAHPVDGGVFDVPPGREEVVIPIDSKLRVADVRAFVLTLERPGGVVVSDGPHLVAATPR